jgi:hypothetical protein
VNNGDFERGRGVGPVGWQRPDELTTFWVKSPGRKGRCIKINTDVLASQFRKREDDIARALEAGREPPPPPKRRPTKEPKYDTVAGLDGVHFRSEEIPVNQGSHYKLEVDVKVDRKAKPKIWIKAYARVTSRSSTRDRVVWKKSLNCNDAAAEWKTYAMVFPASTRFPPGVEKLRIELYHYWPPATYHFDNVRLVEIDEDEVRAFQREHAYRMPPSAEESNGKGKAKPASDREEE